MRTVQDILAKQNTITGIINSEAVNSSTTLIGTMNTNRASLSSSVDAFAGRITLSPSGWIKTVDGTFIYQYTNSKLRGSYFLQVVPLIDTPEQIEAFNKAGVETYITAEENSDTYLFHAKNRPVLSFDITILAFNINDNLVEETKKEGI